VVGASNILDCVFIDYEVYNFLSPELATVELVAKGLKLAIADSSQSRYG
jgi:hypothetical protein